MIENNNTMSNGIEGAKMDDLTAKVMVRALAKLAAVGIDEGWPSVSPADQARNYMDLGNALNELVKFNEYEQNQQGEINRSALYLQRRITDMLEEVQDLIGSHFETINEAAGRVVAAVEPVLENYEAKRCTE